MFAVGSTRATNHNIIDLSREPCTSQKLSWSKRRVPAGIASSLPTHRSPWVSRRVAQMDIERMSMMGVVHETGPEFDQPEAGPKKGAQGSVLEPMLSCSGPDFGCGADVWGASGG